MGRCEKCGFVFKRKNSPAEAVAHRAQCEAQRKLRHRARVLEFLRITQNRQIRSSR
jgi:hypothetical protein